MARIPKVVHYIYLSKGGSKLKPWSLVHHVCVASAARRINPDRIIVHCDQEPEGPWWKLTRDLVEIRLVTAPTSIYGNPLLNPAHKADVLRLGILHEEGGIYLDIDVLVHRDFDDLLDHELVMGAEGENAVHGVANSVMASAPGSRFIARWQKEYVWFRGESITKFWSEHSLQVPLKLSREFPDEITVLDERAFHWPLWTEEGLHALFADPRPGDVKGTYANHLWESKSWIQYLEDLTPGRVRTVDSAFHSWCRPYLDGVPDTYGGTKPMKKLVRYASRTLRKALRA